MTGSAIVYILAGNYQQAVDASRALPHGQRWRYVGEAWQLHGVHGGLLAIAGTFWERRDAAELYDIARAAGLSEDDKGTYRGTPESRVEPDERE